MKIRTPGLHDSNSKLIVYSPGCRAMWQLEAFRLMFREVLDNRELIWRMFLRDFSSRYRHMAFGVFWALATPILTVAAFSLFRKSGVFDSGDVAVPYVLYALAGLTVWQVFSSGVTQSCQALLTGGAMIIKVNFPKEALVFSSMLSVSVDFGIRLVLVLVVMLAYGIAPSPSMTMLPIVMLPLIFVTVGIGFLVSVVNVVFREVSLMVQLSLFFLLLLTPILYAPPTTGPLVVINRLNPLVRLVAVPRNLLLNGTIVDPLGFGVIFICSVCFFVLAWRFFDAAEPRIAEGLGSR
jgi:lipopolysaccharide transport system permease protein